MTRLSWERTKPLLGRLFATWPEQWPHQLAPEAVARLQSPPVMRKPEPAGPGVARIVARIAATSWADHDAMLVALRAACAAGELLHEMRDFEFPPPVAWARAEEAPGEAAARHRVGVVTERLPAIAARDFVAWLRLQRETPSANVAAWLEATGGAGATTPPIELANRAAAGRGPGYEEAIKSALIGAGFDPGRLPALQKGKRCRARTAAFDALVRPGSSMTARVFKTEWDAFQRGRREE